VRETEDDCGLTGQARGHDPPVGGNDPQCRPRRRVQARATWQPDPRATQVGIDQDQVSQCVARETRAPDGQAPGPGRQIAVGRRERTRTGRDPVAVRLRAGSARKPSTLRDLVSPLDRSAARDPNRRRGNLCTAEQRKEQREDVGRDEQAAASGSQFSRRAETAASKLPRLTAVSPYQRARRRRTRVAHLGRLTRAAGASTRQVGSADQCSSVAAAALRGHQQRPRRAGVAIRSFATVWPVAREVVPGAARNLVIPIAATRSSALAFVSPSMPMQIVLEDASGTLPGQMLGREVANEPWMRKRRQATVRTDRIDAARAIARRPLLRSVASWALSLPLFSVG
jgi:hypothetical protein